MKSIINIIEAVASEKGRKKKPSGLYKSKIQARKVMNTYIGSDIYDLHDKGYEKEDTYYDKTYWGFIMDKSGNVYDVIASTSQGDAGRIAGGSTHYYVTIKNVENTDIKLEGYVAVFSNADGDLLISYLKGGMYLEDYLAKFKYKIKDETADSELIQNLIKNGNKDAKLFDTEKEETKKIKDAEFNKRYFNLESAACTFTINDGKVEFDRSFSEINSLYDLLTEYVENIIDKTFVGLSLNELSGISSRIQFFINGKDIHREYISRKYAAFDTKKNNIVCIETSDKGNRKISDTPVEYKLSDTLRINTKKINKELEDWLIKAYDVFRKQKRHEHADWVKQKMSEIQKKNYWSLSDNKARKQAEEQWDDLMQLSNPKNLKGSIVIDTEFIALGNSKIKPKATLKADKPDTSVNELPEIEDNLDNKPKENGEQPELPKGSEEAIEKMKKWHNGERGFNVKAASPAKLKLNYKICKQLGYTDEMKKIEDAAREKGVVLESKFSLSEYSELIKESKELIIPREIRNKSIIDIKKEIKIDKITNILTEYFGDSACSILKAGTSKGTDYYEKILNYFVENGKVIKEFSVNSTNVKVYEIDDNILVCCESNKNQYGLNEIFFSTNLSYLD